jgi:hypothetical protein
MGLGQVVVAVAAQLVAEMDVFVLLEAIVAAVAAVEADNHYSVLKVDHQIVRDHQIVSFRIDFASVHVVVNPAAIEGKVHLSLAALGDILVV